MPPDDESSLKAAFGDLHRRERADAPPFEMMRDRAVKAKDGRQFPSRHVASRWLLWGAPVVGCAVALLLWVSGRLTPPVPESSPAGEPQVASAEHVEQLLNSIERQMEVGEPDASPAYATDALLTQIDTNFAP
jgi:hypothetical protein